MFRSLRGLLKGGFVLMMAALLVGGSVGCGGGAGGGGGRSGGGGGSRGRVSEEDQMRLQQAREEAEAAEKELSEIRYERQQLENANSN